MFYVLLVALGVCMLATLGIVFAGVIGATQQGDFNRKYGNKLMQLRVLMQAIAIAIFALVIYFTKGG
jgi:type III secretory pathway component EscT